MNARRLVLVDIDAHIQRLDVAEDDERLGERSGGGEFARSDVDFQHRSVDRRAHDAAIDLHLHALALGLRRSHRGACLGQARFRSGHRIAPPLHIVFADRAFVAHREHQCELFFLIAERRFGHPDAASRDIEGRVCIVERGAQMPRLQAEQRRAGLHVFAGMDQHLIDDAGEVRSDANVLAARFDETHRSDGVRKVRDGRRGGWVGANAPGLHASDGNGGDDGHCNGNNGKN